MGDSQQTLQGKCSRVGHILLEGLLKIVVEQSVGAVILVEWVNTDTNVLRSAALWPNSTYCYYVYYYVDQFIPSGTSLSCPLHISCIHHCTTLYHIDCPHMTFTTHFTHHTFH